MTTTTPRWKQILTGATVAAMTLTMVPATASASTAHSTAACPVFDLSGSYDVGGPAHPVISNVGGSLTVDMSAFGRPTATGFVYSCYYIEVLFPDDHWYLGYLQAPGLIYWVDNATVWYKIGFVPDVRGLNELDASAVLMGAGFVQGDVTFFFDTRCSYDDRAVATQTPTAGSSAILGTAVDLRIARRPRTCRL